MIAGNKVSFAPQEIANNIVQPVTKESIMKYKHLIDEPLMRNMRSDTRRKELETVIQGYGKKRLQYHIKGIGTMRFF